MRFKFDPNKTYAAIAEIARQWPSAIERMGSDYRALFHRLGTMGLVQVLNWSEGLLPNEVDQICDKIHQVPDARTALAIVFILANRNDGRLAEATRYFFFMQPSTEVIDMMRDHQHRVNLVEKVREVNWFLPLLTEESAPEVLVHAVALLEKGWLILDELDETYVHTALYQSLLDLAFDKGGAMLKRIKPEPAHERVMTYLKKGFWKRIIRYISEYPATFWRPAFLEALYEARGRPDRRKNPFYERLPEGSLWTLRQRLFQSRMNHSKSPHAQQAFWMSRLHHCQDWLNRGTLVEILLNPLRIMEEAGCTRVFHEDQPEREIAVVRHGHGYEQEMEHVLRDYLPW